MHTRLEEAFAKASQLPPDEQEALAALRLDEIASKGFGIRPLPNPKTRSRSWLMRL